MHEFVNMQLKVGKGLIKKKREEHANDRRADVLLGCLHVSADRQLKELGRLMDLNTDLGLAHDGLILGQHTS